MHIARDAVTLKPMSSMKLLCGENGHLVSLKKAGLPVHLLGGSVVTEICVHLKYITLKEAFICFYRGFYALKNKEVFI